MMGRTAFTSQLAGGLIAVVLLAGPATAKLAVGERGAVAAEHIEASRAGIAVLNAGGNAVDAAVASALAIGVVNPSSAGLGGGGFLVLYLAREGRAHTIDFREAAPRRGHRDMYVRAGKLDSEASKTGGLAVAVPGEPAGLALAVERFGRLGLAEVAAPAIRLATDGFTVKSHLAKTIARLRDEIAADPALAEVFLDAKGKPYKVGERLQRPRLAATLKTFAAEGSEPFYDGAIAAKIVEAVRGAGGLLEAADLEAYEPHQRPPVVVEYKRWQVIGMAPPSSGGGVAGQTLGVLAPYRLVDLGRNSVTYLHLLGETFKAVFADRAVYYGDPDVANVPLARLLAARHLAGIRSRLSAVRTVPASDYGNTAGLTDAGTSHVSVIDEQGNAAALTSSINTAFGSKLGVPGTGIVLNNTMNDFSLRPGVANVYGLVGSEANAIAPAKRPLSSMSPTIVLEGAVVRLAVGGSGGPLIITGTLQTLINVLDFSMDVRAAVRSPRVHNQWRPDVLLVEDGIADITKVSLRRRGHTIKPMPYVAAVQAVETIHNKTGRTVRAYSDIRKGGYARAQ